MTHPTILDRLQSTLYRVSQRTQPIARITMGLCTDSSVKHLKGLGYNVVRLPKANILPLQLLGVNRGDPRLLGNIADLPRTQGVALPKVTEDRVAANINGQASSKFSLDLGINILGSFISAMGGNLGISTTWTNASKVQFEYQDVTEDFVDPLAVGTLLEDGNVRFTNPVLTDYLFGRGDLFVSTAVIKSPNLTVSFEKSNGVAAQVDVPVIQQAVGGKIKVQVDNARSHVVKFQGQQALVFGFQCFRIYVDDGTIKLSASKAGATFLSVSAPPKDGGVILRDDDGVIDL